MTNILDAKPQSGQYGYGYGSNGSDGNIDCSHLVNDMLRESGYDIPYENTAAMDDNSQYYDEVDPADVQSGDIAVWKDTNANDGSNVNAHTGVVESYDGSNGQFYGSQSSTGPATANFGGNSGYWPQPTKFLRPKQEYYNGDPQDPIDNQDPTQGFGLPGFLQDFFKDLWDRAKNWFPRGDPIILDLDGNGLETVGLASNVYFDHDGDGVLTKTGWVSGNDGLLVWDKNNNSEIENGSELFGDFSVMPNGMLAPNGFAALAALDANGDGILDASDPAFAELKLWRDINQDGVSQGGEFITLADAGIASLNISNELKNRLLPNGNTLSREGSFTRTDGSTSAMGEFNLAIDTFHTKFTEEVVVPDAVRELPNMGGAGNVRELQQAAAQSGSLQNVLTQFSEAGTRTEQKALLDDVLQKWADSSGMAESLEERAEGKYRIQYDSIGGVSRSANVSAPTVSMISSGGGGGGGSGIGNSVMSDIGNQYLSESYRNLITEWSNKLHVLEAFNGQYFFNLPEQKSQTRGASIGMWASAGSSGGSGISASINAMQTLHINLFPAQLDPLNQAYASLKESVYASLVMQTRLRPYFDELKIRIDDTSVRIDATALNKILADKLANDTFNGLGDLLELDRYAGNILSATNWDGLTQFDQWIDTLPQTASITALLNEFKVQRLGADDDSSYLSSDNDIVLAGEGGDVLYGNNGNDRLFGQDGDDLLSGGAGNDELYGSAGADTYVFGRGYGNDTIIDYAENGVQRDTVRLLGLIPADIQVMEGPSNFISITIRDTGKTLNVSKYSWWNQTQSVGSYVFDDGTVWSHDDFLRSSVATATDDDDVIQGSSVGDFLVGQAGNDTLIGNDGDDVMDGGTGNDVLVGSTGWNWNDVNGQYERNTTPTISANGNDIYLFGRGDGQDTVIDGDWTTGNSDTLGFKEGVAPEDVRVVQIGTDLVLKIRNSDDSVTLKKYFDESYRNNNPSLIEQIAFADGTVWSFSDVREVLFAGSEEAETIYGTLTDDVISGQGGNDVLLGSKGYDVLDGGAGDDVLRGGASASSTGVIADQYGEGDTYRFGRGDGHDTIIESSWQAGEIDRIELKEGVTSDDVRLERIRSVNGWVSEDSLKLTIRDTGETITVKNHFNASDRFAVEEIVFADGTVWNTEDIKNRVLLGEAGDDVLRGFSNRDDLIVGAAGNDVLEGGTGSDTYRFDVGSGQDVITESYDSGIWDIVELAAGITPEDVSVRWTQQGGMSVRMPDGSVITVQNQAKTWLAYDGVGIEALRFADGTVWDRTELAARALTVTSGDDAVVAGYEDNVLEGGTGNDSFQDLSGYDTYRFGTGDGQDVITDDYGRVIFKSGIDQNDVVFTMSGNDLMVAVNAEDSVLIKDWINTGQGIDFYFNNGAHLSANDVITILGVGDGSEILYGSPGDDVLAGTEKSSTIYGRESDDTLTGGAGQDFLYGEEGNDTLDGGASRDDLLYGGAGQNTYVVTQGMGLDNALAASASVADDTVVFAPGITLADVSVQLGYQSGDSSPGAVGYTHMVVGIGGNDAMMIQNESWGDIGLGATQHFRFADGTELSLADMIARADDGVVGWQQRYSYEANTILGSQADDQIYDTTGDSVTVSTRGNNDTVELFGGNNIISAGSGEDSVYAGAADDVIAGEAGDDYTDGAAGNDVFLFNYGDGNDVLVADVGLDTLSFGANINPEMLSLAFDASEQLVLLVDGGAGGKISLQGITAENFPGDLERLQFVDAEGKARTFDFTAWLDSNAASLSNTSFDAPLAFDGAGFELTGIVAPVGGLEAIAYAQSANLFAEAELPNNIPTDGDDVLYGTADDDELDGGAGNDILLGLAGYDVLNGGAGNDILNGGLGEDDLTGGGGSDQLYGDWGGDTYHFQAGDGEVIIDDNHRVLNWSYGGSPPPVAPLVPLAFGEGYGEGYGENAFVDDAPNELLFGPDIQASDLRYSEQNGDLVIEFAGRPGDRIILRGYDPARATQTRSIDAFRFADGTEIIADSIVPTGVTVYGDDQGSWLEGSTLADTLIGGEGDDYLEGNGGADRLVGGTGSDTYLIYRDWDDRPTETVIMETWRDQDHNNIELTGDVSADELRLEFDGRDLILRLRDGGDSIRFAGFDPRQEGMQMPVDEIRLPWENINIGFDELLARGIRIIGTPEDDVLTGTALSDWIEGREANDTMSGGAGGDIYVIGDDGGTDSIIDAEEGGEPNVLVLPEGTVLEDIYLSFDQEGFLILDLYNTGNRIRLSGFDPMDPLGARAVEYFRFGMNGDQISYEELLLSRGFDISGTDENDLLSGTLLTDRIYGGYGNDVIDATSGGDTLYGGSGDDVYTVNLGDGGVTIDDWAEIGAGNVLRFGPGIEPASLQNNLRFAGNDYGGYDLLIPYGEFEDVVRLTNFDPQNVLGGHAIDRFEFDDGTSVDYATLVSWTFVVEGDSDSNALMGTNVGDRLYGYSEEDLLEAGDGEDVLTGGKENDLLRGGSGRDAYVVNLGDGQDIIEDSIEAGIGNVLAFGEGIAREDIQVVVDGDDLLISYGNGGDAVRVSDYAADATSVIDTFRFFDGVEISLREFLNHAPVVGNAVADQTTLEDAPFSLTLPDDLFVDEDGPTFLSRVEIVGYEGTPDWLQFDADTRTLYGTPTNDNVGEFEVVIQAVDELGDAAFHSFVVTVQNTNDAPEVGAILTSQLAHEDSSFIYTLPADTFFDVDAGDALNYSATLENGEPLPDWLSFDAQTQTFSGTPMNGNVGDLQVRVTAVDLAGASASQGFTLYVSNTNDAPTVGVALSSQQALEDTLFSYTLPANAFNDSDLGDHLVFAATLTNGDALPAWMQFDASTGTFSGTPGNDDLGLLQVRVTTTDTSGASVSQDFGLTVSNTNDAPEVSVVISDLQAVEDAVFSYTVPANAFRDVDVGDVVSLSATLADGSPLPIWLTFNAQTQTFTGTPLNGDVGNVSLRVLATDVAGAQASQTFNLSVLNTNDAPLVAEVLTNQTTHTGTAYSWQLPQNAFIDIDVGDKLSYSASMADGSALPSWLSFNTATGTLGGTPTIAQHYNIQITATDLAGASASQVFALDVAGGNAAPQTVADTATVTEDRTVLACGNVLTNDVDPDGQALVVSNPGVQRGQYGALKLLANGSYTYVLDNYSSKVQSLGAGEQVVDRFNYLASDGSNSTQGELAILVQGTNDVPFVSRALDDMQLAKGKAFSWQIPTGSFADRDQHDTLSYTASLSNGKPLPSWLKFDSATQTFSGTAPSNSKDSFDVKVVASDGQSANSTASDVFRVSFGSKTGICKGNEGVGNGYDAPPRGHDYNYNDGPGTSPGQPGHKPQNKDDDSVNRFLDSFKSDNKSADLMTALDRSWFAKLNEQQQQSDQSNSCGANDFYRHWSELANALGRLDAERQCLPSWSNPNVGFDNAGLIHGGSQQGRGGVDTISLEGDSNKLAGFSGLHEGFSKLK